MGTITVLYFGMLRERRGCTDERVSLAGPATAREVFLRLLAGTPEVALPVAFAVNATYVAGDTPVRDGDELAFLPPVGGG